MAKRKCSACGATMDFGFCIGNGDEYFCSEECLHTVYTHEEYMELYNDENAYWTMWWDEADEDEPDKLLVAHKKPGEPVQWCEIPNSVSALQGLVGGYFQIGKAFCEGVVVLCDEEGLLKGKQYNCMGLVGELVFIGVGKEDFRSLTGEEILKIKEWEAEVFGE